MDERKQRYGDSNQEHNDRVSAAFFLQRFARLARSGQHHRPTGPAKAIVRSDFGLARPTLRFRNRAAARFVCHCISDAYAVVVYRAGLREMW